MVPSNSVLAKTSQTWKIGIGLVGQILGALSLLAGLHGRGSPLLAFGGLLLAAIATVGPWISIRCAKCGTRWLWMAVRTQPNLQWLRWLGEQERCPTCGDDPTPGRT